MKLNILLTQINNAILAKKTKVIIRTCKFFMNILYKLKKEHLINDFKEIKIKNSNFVCIYFIFKNEKDSINKIKIIKNYDLKTKPKYIKYNEINNFLSKNNKSKNSILFISTNSGILNQKEAFKTKKGGKLLFTIN